MDERLGSGDTGSVSGNPIITQYGN